MCVICHKPAGVEMPSDETIKKMFSKNPHGAGFAIQGDLDHNGKFNVEFHKGFMKVEDLLTALHKRNDMKDLTVVIHTRIKTSGNTDTYTTHPFKMSSNYQDLRKLNGRGSVLFHNGVFNGLGGMVDPKSSDTQDFVIGVAMHYMRQAKPPKKVGQAITEQIVGSCRVIILYPNQKYPYIKLGSWTKHTDGCEYSNMLWNETSSYSSGYYSDWGSYRTYRRPSKPLSYGESTTKKLDRYGCNIAEYAWPTKESKWVNAGTIDRYNIIIKSAKEIDDTHAKEGYLTCNFISTSEDKWFVIPDTLDFIHEDMLEAYTKKQEDTQLMWNFNADIEDEIVSFDDEEELLDFMNKGKRISDYEVELVGKQWLVDVVNLEAFTMQGIKEYFKTGEQGHVAKYLKETGCQNKYGVENYEETYHHQRNANIKDDGFDDIDLELIEEAEAVGEEVDRYYGLN